MKNTNDERETLDAINKLGAIAQELDGYYQEPIEMRKEAIITIGSYMPHPRAMEILTHIASERGYNSELRALAIKYLRKS